MAQARGGGDAADGMDVEGRDCERVKDSQQPTARGRTARQRGPRSKVGLRRDSKLGHANQAHPHHSYCA